MEFMVLIPIIVFVIAFLFIASVAFSSFKKAKKNVNRSIPVIEQSFNEHLNKVAMASIAKQENKTCEYCGSNISSEANKCDSCGAKVKK